MIKYIPDMTLQETLKFHEALHSISPDDEMIFDFSRMSNFDPLPMLMMGAIIRNYRNKFPNVPFRIAGYENKSYAKTMVFLSIFQHH